MKSPGSSSPRCGWCQRIRASAPARRRLAKLDLGLEVELELATGEAAADLLQELVVAAGTAVTGRIEQVVAVLARQLGQVHGLVGMAQQGFGVLLVVGVERDTDAGAEHQFLAVDGDRPRHPLQQALQAADAFLRRLQADQQHHELVAAEAGHGIVLAHRFADAARDFDQHAVANGMAEAVVDRLEAVEVEVAHRQQALLALGAGQRLRQPVGQHDAVGHAGKGVVMGEALELLFMFHAHAQLAPQIVLALPHQLLVLQRLVEIEHAGQGHQVEDRGAEVGAGELRPAALGQIAERRWRR
jgi:hypothetical protein